MNEEDTSYNHVFTLRQKGRQYYIDSLIVFPVWYEDYLRSSSELDALRDEEIDQDIQRKSTEIMALKMRARFNSGDLYSLILPEEMSLDELESFFECYSVEEFDKLMDKAKATIGNDLPEVNQV